MSLFSPIFSSFTALSIMFMSLIYVELIFVYGIRLGFKIICLHVDIQFSQHHL